MISIDKNHELTVDENTSRLVKTTHREGYLRGSLMGYVDRDTTLNSSQALEKLKECMKNGGDLTSFMRWSIGSFFIIIVKEREIEIYTSPKGPGFFYYNKNSVLHITTDELRMARDSADSGLNEMELIHLICANPSPPCSPFTTLFASAKRMPGGTKAVINREGKIGLRMYMADYSLSLERSDEENYKAFKEVFEQTCNLICKSHKHDTIYATISGGIDSSVILAACLKSGFDIIPLHWKKNTTLTTAINILCERLGVKAEFIGQNYGIIDPIKLDWEKARHFYSNSLGILGIGHMYLPFADSPADYITGIGFGCVIQTNGLMRSNFGESIIRRYYEDSLKKKPLRYLFTEGFFNHIKKANGSLYLKLAEKLSKEKGWVAPKNIFEYLLSLTISNKLPCWPPKILPDDISTYKKDYIKYIELETFAHIIGSELYDKLNRNKGKAISFEDARRLSRLIRYAIQIQRASKNDSCFERSGKYILQAPPIEGPVLSFFMNQPLTLKDVFKPKRYLFRYFREEVGYSYDVFLNKIRGQKYKRPAKQYVASLKRRLGLIKGPNNRPSHKKLLINSQVFREKFLSVLNPEDSILIPLIKDVNIRTYVRKLYANCKNRDLYNLKQVNQLLNLELFLRNVHNK